VLTIRCTQKLLTRLKVPPDSAPGPSTTKLGDWYANLVYIQRQQLILAVSERTLLPVLFPVRGKETLRDKLIRAAGEMLMSVGIDGPLVDKELSAMAEGSIAKTASRVVLGSMNDFLFMLQSRAQGQPAPLSEEVLFRECCWLAGTPCSPLKEVFPDKATTEAFKRPGGHLRVV
jgi:hypothetical protein